jgi:TolB-like protein/DNA-binding winged helix-turn-helix (wHTH) protein/tetratricopeptide (TPR) repeat protein
LQQRSEASPPRRYRVADLEIDVERVRVMRGDVELALPRLTFDLLVAIVEIAPAVATSDALLDRVWPGLVVSPETLVQRVKLLRTALGDDPRRPRYIAVVRGRGYRLLADVERVVDADGEKTRELATSPPHETAHTVAPAHPIDAGHGAIERTSTPPQAARARTRVALGVAAGAALIALALTWNYARRPSPGVTAPAGARSATVATPGTRAPSTPEMPGTEAVPSRRSIAVLPFESLSGDPEDALYARGVAAAVLHQLGTLRELEVIARRSSFAFAGGASDARETGQRLRVRYLLDGTVQRDSERVRVTAQLVDASTATQVWSMQLDRPRREPFALEDEIATKVAEAFDLSTTSPGAARLRGQGTNDFDAYLEFLRARALLAGDRVTDFDTAISRLRRAVALDPEFAPAYVSLADAEVRRAEFAPSPSRAAAFAAASARARTHVERALALDPNDGAAYLQRAHLQAYTDLAAAEADYRHGLELAPNDAEGHAGLATVVYENPRRTAEALALIDRARRLDPLEPRYDVTKAILLAYARSDIAGAVELLRDVVARNPGYVPALARYGELLLTCTGDTAEGIRVLSEALAMDLESETVRRLLISGYLDVDDAASAAILVGDPARAPPGRAVDLYAYRGDWLAAGRDAYAAYAADAVLPPFAVMAGVAVRMHARATHEYARARALLEDGAGIVWGPDGVPTLDEPPGIKAWGVNAAYVLRLAGEGAAADRLLRAVLADDAYDERDLERGSAWITRSRAVALALLGDRDGAVATLVRARGALLQFRAWYFLEREDAFAALRDRPDFAAVVRDSRLRRDSERARLDALRAAGRIRAPATLAPRDVAAVSRGDAGRR